LTVLFVYQKQDVAKNENDREFMSSSYSNALLYDAGWNYSKGA
jgi:hypothetical protein